MHLLLQGVPVSFSDLIWPFICPLIGLAIIAILGFGAFYGFPKEEEPKPGGFEVILPKDRPPTDGDL